MAINLHCTICKSGSKLGTKECKKCGIKLSATNRKYRVMVKLPNGKRRSKVVGTLDLVKKIEAKFKTESVEQDVFHIQKAPLISDIWVKYLAWAKKNKKSWKEDETRWKYHIEPHLKNPRHIAN